MNKQAIKRPLITDETIAPLINLFAMGLFAELELLARDLVDSHPRHPLAWRLLVAALEQQNKSTTITQSASNQHSALAPSLVESCFHFALAQQQQGYMVGAIACYRLLLQTQPDAPDAWNNLSLCLRLDDRLDEAMACCRRALGLRPDFALAHNNLGLLLKDAARIDESAAAFRKAIDIDPSYTEARSNLAYLLSFYPGLDASAIRTEVEALFNDVVSNPITLKRPPRSDEQRLRIGYVSPDFRDHCQSLFTIPLLEHHDRSRFEIACYADLDVPDAHTERIKCCADIWRLTRGMDDAELARRIAEDNIDILVDLTMHMAGGRPRLFARRAAPMQIAWLAYPGTTGIRAMDFRLTDPWLDPPEADDSVYTERSLHLADTFWCYDPQLSDLEPSPLPAIENGFITFGSLNNFCKVSYASVITWAAVMTHVPGSRLLLLAPNGQHRQQVLHWMAEAGIDAERIEFVGYQPRREYLATYHRVDLCLDTLPYNGHTTSLDAFWMGVPVITQVGTTVAGRAGWSQLNNLSLPELAAFSTQAFIDKAVAIAMDVQHLQTLRSQLRPRLQASPLMNAERFARTMETALSSAWRTLETN